MPGSTTPDPDDPRSAGSDGAASSVRRAHPLVTIVIPARNEEASITAAVESVVAQTHPTTATEVVVVDGDSTDRTAVVAASALEGRGFARTAVLDNPGGSTPSNLNRGLAWARGDYVVRVDARSRIPHDYVARLVAVLADHPEIAVCGGSQVAVARSDDARDIAIARALNNRLAMGGARYRRPGAASGPTDTAYLGVFRTDDLRCVGGWNPDYPTNQDFELNQRLGALGTIWFEAGLDVGYVPRASVPELARQYHRFGRWKARYWADGHRPRPRQLAMLAMPAMAVLVAIAIVVVGGPIGLLAAAALALAAPLVVDGAGAVGSASLVVRAVAGVVNLVIAASWSAGASTGSVLERIPGRSVAPAVRPPEAPTAPQRRPTARRR